jgi:hypothetical protein
MSLLFTLAGLLMLVAPNADSAVRVPGASAMLASLPSVSMEAPGGLSGVSLVLLLALVCLRRTRG